MAKRSKSRSRPAARASRRKGTKNRQLAGAARRAFPKLIALFVASGATSLVYQTLWARHLAVVVGTSQLAICTVLTAFMGGLALGSFAGARYARRFIRPVRVYALLEAFIGGYALAFPLLIDLTSPLYLALSSQFEPGSATLAVAQLLMLGTLMLPPTLCMGATLPLLVRFISPDGTKGGVAVGGLYGANTLGAVIGTGLAGFWLLPALGLAATTRWTALANGLLALGAFLLERGVGAQASAQSGSAQRGAGDRATLQSAPGGASLWVPILMIAGLTGFGALLCEVAWFRLLTLMFGGSAYSFSVMLLAFLLGISVGGWLGGRAADRSLAAGSRPRVLIHLAGLQLGVAALCWAAIYAYQDLPLWMLGLQGITEGHPTAHFVAQIGLALALMLPPALLMGASFPYLVTAAGGNEPGLDRPVGLVYGANTLGSIAGASLGGLVVLPALHVLGAVLLAVSVNITAAFIAATSSALQSNRGLQGVAAYAAAAAVALAVALGLRPEWNPLLMTSGVSLYGPDWDATTRAELFEEVVMSSELLFYAEGRSSVVTVGRDEGGANIWLSTNGKVDASSQADMGTQVMLGQLASFFHAAPKRALNIGLASGASAGSMLLNEHIERLDIVELEAATVEASAFFNGVNNQPLKDPRSHLIINDARNHLLRQPDGTYDIVVSEPSNPWLTGVSNLFTREFFALGKRKLSPDGIWVQWVQTYGMAPDDLRSLLATFAATYSHVHVYRIDEQDLVVLGRETPLNLRARQIFEFCQQRPAVLLDLRRVGFRSAEAVVGLFAFDRKALMKLAGGVEHNTDDNMRIEYSAPLNLHEDTIPKNNLLIESHSIIPLFAMQEGDLLSLTRFYAEHDTYWNRPLQAVRLALELRPDDPETQALFDEYHADLESRTMFRIQGRVK